MSPLPAGTLRKRKNKSSTKTSTSNNNNNNKNATDDNNDDDDVIDMFGMNTTNGQSDFDFPMPPSMMSTTNRGEGEGKKPKPVNATTTTTSSSSATRMEEEEEDSSLPAPSRLSQQQKGKKNNKRRGGSSKGGDNENNDIQLPNIDKGGGIKWLPILFLFIMFGTTLFPILFYVGDSISGLMTTKTTNNQSSSTYKFLGKVGYTLGIGTIPKKRVLSFYEKHNPEKVDDVPKVLYKYYGDYPTLIKKLERKYNDHGYFIGWKDDESTYSIIQEQFHDMYSYWIQSIWNKYIPLFVRNRVRNVQYNITTLYKQIKRLWKKNMWPVLQPWFGIPDTKTAERQKRDDARRMKERQKRSSSSSRGGGGGGRRKNTDFRDDVDEQE